MTVDVPVESPQGNVLNYSIISSDEEENPLVLKLKLSDRNRVPVVVLTKLDELSEHVLPSRTSTRLRKSLTFNTNLSLVNHKKLENESTSPGKRRRHQKFAIEEIEMISPQKKEKTRSTTTKSLLEYDVDVLCSSLKNDVALRTPVKRMLLQSDTEGSPKKKNKSPMKQNFRTEKLESENGIINNKRVIRTPARYCDEISPLNAVKVVWNDSFPRSSLRCRLNLDNGRQKPEEFIRRVPNLRKSSLRDANTESNTKRCSRRSFAQFYYNTDEDDDDIDMIEVLKKSEKEVVAKRVLRSRSNSSASNVSENSEDLVGSSKTPSKRGLRQRKMSLKNLEKSPIQSSETPKNRKQSARTPRSVKATPKTPKSRLKLLREGIITPSMQSRTSLVPKDTTPLMQARSQLHVSYVPQSLPCREKEYLDIYNFLKGKLEDGYGGCMYISGVPGTGKTATVTSVIDNLRNHKKNPKFSYVSINGMRLTEPRQSYVEIWKQLTGKTVSWEQAQHLLEEQFTKKKKNMPIIMLIDELDILCTKRQDVVYNLLDWPTKSKDQLIVITIANTMDLPERLLMSKVTSRLGLTRLTFQAYTHKQLMEIVTKRLTGTNSFNSDAIQLVARKVASVSGDARRALDICRRAAEVAESEGDDQQVNIEHINVALDAMVTQPQITAINRCSRLQKLILQAVVAEIERTGVEETTFSDVFKMLVPCCALDGFRMVSSTVAQRAICELSACRLIVTDQKCSDVNMKIILNVSVHDVYFALKRE